MDTDMKSTARRNANPMLPTGPTRTTRAFSLVELLVVLTIISIVIGVLIPSLRAARNSARASASQSVIRDVSSAAQRFKIDNKRDPGYFSATDMGSAANVTSGFSGMQNVILDLAGGVTTASGGAILTSVGPINTGQVNVDVGLIGATNNAPTSAANIASVGGYYIPDRKYFEVVKGRYSNGGEQFNPESLPTSAGNARMPDLVDAFGQPILAWVADPRKTPRFVARDSSAEPARFYWNSNSTYLRSSSLGREGRPQVFIDMATPGSLIGSAGLGAATPPAHAVSGTGEFGSLASLLGNPAFAEPGASPADPARAILPRGTLTFHSAGRDGIYLNALDAGSRKWAIDASGAIGANGMRIPSNGTDPLLDYDDIVQPANN